MEYIRRANLDYFGSRESSTVPFNLHEAWRVEIKVVNWLGMPSSTPPMGPFPLTDECGIIGPMAMLDSLLDPGWYADHVQHWLFWNVWSTITNIIQAGVGGWLEDSTGASQRNKIWTTKAATHKFWFSRFMEGLPIEEIHACNRSGLGARVFACASQRG